MSIKEDFLIYWGLRKPKPLSPLQQAVIELEQAQRDSLVAEARAEEATATAEMLKTRINRLSIEVNLLRPKEY